MILVYALRLCDENAFVDGGKKTVSISCFLVLFDVNIAWPYSIDGQGVLLIVHSVVHAHWILKKLYMHMNKQKTKTMKVELFVIFDVFFFLMNNFYLKC